MGLIGGAIGAGVSAIAGIFGGRAASKAMKNIEKDLNQQQTENQNWYDRRYNEDATQRADAQAMLSRTEESIRQRNRAAAGAAAVGGATDEIVAAAKAANNKVLTDATTDIVVNAERRKDAIESQYQAKDAALRAELNDLQRQKAGQVSQAIQGVQQAAAGMGGAF